MNEIKVGDIYKGYQAANRVIIGIETIDKRYEGYYKVIYDDSTNWVYDSFDDIQQKIELRIWKYHTTLTKEDIDIYQLLYLKNEPN